MTPLSFIHVDVFSPMPYGGNSLAVFPDAMGLSADQMLRITQELRHFETIFLVPGDAPSQVSARVFDLVEELPFAGHPIIGAAAVLHRQTGQGNTAIWQFVLLEKTVTVESEATAANRGVPAGVFARLDQGCPSFGVEVEDRTFAAKAFSLSPDDLDLALPLAVVSTGLRYLIIPVAPDVLGRAQITQDIGDWLSSLGADYAVLLDDAELEVRHWTNDGLLEDVATGSAAGTIGAFRLHYRRASAGDTFTLHQGRFLNRPSKLHVTPHGTPENVNALRLGARSRS